MKRVKAMRKKWHPELEKARVRIDVLMVSTDGEDGAAIKANGYPADGLAKILPQEQRGAGTADARILLDAEKYDSLEDKERDALIDHELQHFQVVMKDGVIVLDGNERPKLRMRRHDVQVGWFSVIAERHKEHSAEVQQAKAIVQRAASTYLPGFEFLDKNAKPAGKVVPMPQQTKQSAPKAQAATPPVAAAAAAK